MKRKMIAIVMVLVELLSIICLISCTNNKPIEDGDNNSNNPFLFRIVSTQNEFKTNEDVKLAIAYGWRDDIEKGAMMDNKSLNMTFSVMSFTSGECDSILIQKEYFVTIVENFDSLKYQVSKNDNKYYFNYSEIIVLPKELFVGASGQLAFTMQDVEHKLEYGLYAEISYEIRNDILLMNYKHYDKEFEIINSPQITKYVNYQDLSFNWRYVRSGFIRSDCENIKPVIVHNVQEMKKYCVDNNMTLVIDNNINFKDNNVGNKFKEYGDDYFENKILVIIPIDTYVTNAISSVYLNNCQLYVVKAKYEVNTNNKELNSTLYFVEISKAMFEDSSLIKYVQFFEEIDWYDYLKIT